LAIEERVQCVAFGGVDSNVATNTSSTWSVVIDAGRPGRGSSTNPSSRSSQNRERHLPTVACDTPTTEATSAFARPAVHLNTIRDREPDRRDDGEQVADRLCMLWVHLRGDAWEEADRGCTEQKVTERRAKQQHCQHKHSSGGERGHPNRVVKRVAPAPGDTHTRGLPERRPAPYRPDITWRRFA
jgi:hypothetical protein